MTEELTNRDAVVAELQVLRAILKSEPEAELSRARTAAKAAAVRHGRPTTMDRLADGFGLSSFERSVLLLTAGPELIGAVAQEIAELGAGSRLTFGAALAVLPDSHWSALTPVAPLRRWQLVHLVDPASPAHSPLVVAERVLHFLAGAGHPDGWLAARADPARPVPVTVGPLVRAVAAVGRAWAGRRPVLLSGPQPANLRAVAAGAAIGAGLTAMIVGGNGFPADPTERETMVRRMERETILGGVAWLIEADGDRDEVRTLTSVLARLDAPVALLCRSPALEVPPDAVRLRVDRLGPADRRGAWQAGFAAVTGRPLDDAAADLAAGAFDLSLVDIERVARDVADGAELTTACRAVTGGSYGGLADVVTPRAGWDDLVLPEPQREQLQALVAAVRHRTRVLDDWGFGERSARGQGITALFAGPSGTGKSRAAEVIAHELGLDLVVVDLSQVVSKYIGETEKQLRRLFDSAEDGGCVLLFDEADTLFGRRSEVWDSHDRYANLEVGYLLQRTESFRGLAILTTNSRDALDPAFTRRLRTVVTFPYPDEALRQELWRQAFPPQAPVADVDSTRLAALDLPGGGIAAAALTAAYLADGRIGRSEIHRAARWELAKNGRSLRLPAD